MIEFTIRAESAAPAAAVLAGARDFSPRRIDVWPNVSPKRYAVHARGETFVEVTEGALRGIFWERTRYEWDEDGSIRQTVLESNVLEAGSTWELRASPAAGGCEVEATFRRTFRRTLKGRIGQAINRRGQGLYAGDLRKAVAAIERTPEYLHDDSRGAMIA